VVREVYCPFPFIGALAALTLIEGIDSLIGHMSTAEFPTRLPEKLNAIREHLGMTPDQLAPFVGAKTGAEIETYENNEDDLLVSVLFGY